MSGFTKGEWFVSDGKDLLYLKGKVCILEEDGIPTVVCDLNSYFPPSEFNANAHLIAAAPKMYDLLERLTDHNNNKKQIIHLLGEADSLLKKARGEV